MSEQVVYVTDEYEIIQTDDGFDIVEYCVQGLQGIQGIQGEPANLGGSLRSVAGKAEAGGAWMVLEDDEVMNLSESNRFIVIVDEGWGFPGIIGSTPAPGTTLAVKIVLFDGAQCNWSGITWPDPGTPPTIPDNPNKITSLAFEWLPNGQILGFIGPTHSWEG